MLRIRLTKRLWRLHSWLGLLCGCGLLVLGVTGSLLVFHDELDTWRFPELYRVQPSGAGRLPYDKLWAGLCRALPGEKVVGWMPAPQPDRADGIYVMRPGEEEARGLHLNPYTGMTLGGSTETDRTLTGWLLRLHNSFLGGTVGTFVAGLLAVGLLVLGASGVWLYRGFWRNLFLLRWNRSARIFFSDLHKAVGISSVAFNLVLGFTGAWWNLNTVYSQWMRTAAVAPGAPAPAPVAADLDFGGSGISLDALVARAGRELSGYHVVYIALPPQRQGTITFFGTVPTANPLRGDYGSRLSFAAPKGQLLNVTDIRKASLWEKIGDAFVLLHFGTFGAVFGRTMDIVAKIVWVLLGLSPGVLAVSGFLIWRSRAAARGPGALN